MNITIILATNCIKIYWKGLGTVMEISNTVITCMVKVKPGLKNVTMIMVSITTGIIKINDGCSFMIQYDGIIMTTMSSNSRLILLNALKTSLLCSAFR